MLIESISVCHFGAVSHDEATFQSGFNEMQTSAVPEFATALELILRNHTLNYQKLWIRDDTKIEAVVQTKQAKYRVALTPNRDRSELLLLAFDQNDANRTRQYLQTVQDGAKENNHTVFHGNDRNIYFALKRCDEEENGKSGGSLPQRGDGVFNMQAFHSYRRRYITDFQPIPIQNGTFLSLREDGSFAVEDARRNLCTGQLSETDECLARYLCFLQVAAFWDGFE